jgi:hypothetical protein
MFRHSCALLLIAVLALMPIVPPAMATDDPSCMRLPCLGKCASRKDMEGKAIPMLCMRQSNCYNNVDCTILDDGKCGWKGTPELAACLADKSGGMPITEEQK